MRLLVGLLMLYVAADLASPAWPGAFSFDPDESVEAMNARLSRIDGGAPAAPDRLPSAAAFDTAIDAPPARRASVSPAAAWTPHQRPRQTIARDSSASVDDH